MGLSSEAVLRTKTPPQFSAMVLEGREGGREGSELFIAHTHTHTQGYSIIPQSGFNSTDPLFVPRVIRVTLPRPLS